jgi:hypothetical protein
LSASCCFFYCSCFWGLLCRSFRILSFHCSLAAVGQMLLSVLLALACCFYSHLPYLINQLLYTTISYAWSGE